MGFKEKMKELGGASLSFLTEDGECLEFMVAGDPELIEGKYKGKDTARIGIPIFTMEGFSLLIIGKRVARRLAKYEKQFAEVVFLLIRHGESRSTETTYELSTIDDKDRVAKLVEISRLGIDKDELKEAFASAREVAAG